MDIPKLPISNSYNITTSQDSKLTDLIRSNESISKKMILLTDQVNDIIKSICSNCGFSQSQVNNDASLNLCSICNAIFCADCIKAVSCTKCRRKVCVEHCVKCQICDKRSCKDKGCIFDFRICQACECTYCQEHFDAHKKFNQTEPYKIACTSEKTKLGQWIGAKAFEDFTSTIINARLLKELRIRKHMT